MIELLDVGQRLRVNSYLYALGWVDLKSFVLDVGCGDGCGTLLLAIKAAHATGLDKDKELVAQASERWSTEETEERIAFEVWDGEVEGVPECPTEEDWNAIVALLFIERLNDPRLFLTSAAQALGRGGVMVVSFSCKPTGLAKQSYTPSEMRELAGSCGLEPFKHHHLPANGSKVAWLSDAEVSAAAHIMEFRRKL